MISLPGTMTKRSSRTGPALMPPRLTIMERSARSFMSIVRGQVMRRGSMPRALPWCRWLSSIARQQVVRRGDGVEVAREVQVDLVHRDDLGVAATGGAALHPEHRAERRLADADDDLLAQPPERLRHADGDGALALAGRRRVDAGDEHEPALRLPLRDDLGRDLRLGAAVGQDVVGAEAELGRDVGDGAQVLAAWAMSMSDGTVDTEPPAGWNGWAALGGRVNACLRWYCLACRAGHEPGPNSP